LFFVYVALSGIGVSVYVSVSVFDGKQFLRDLNSYLSYFPLLPIMATKTIYHVFAMLVYTTAYIGSLHSALAQRAGQIPEQNSIEITGTFGTIRLGLQDIEILPRFTFAALPHNERDSVLYTGVLFSDVLIKAGEVSFGKNMRGAVLAKSVVVRARDGYAVTFGIAELDTAVTPQPVFLAYKRNGSSLAPDETPFRLVIPGDTRRQARWVRMVEHIEIRGNAVPLRK
jgi:Oxidoreductase molybdopterin binding domain